MNIAICDDDKNICDQVKTYLSDFFKEYKELNLDLKIFNSGEEVCDYYLVNSNAPLDMIFIDIEMNEIDGIEAVKKLQNAKYKRLIVFFITSYTKYAPETFRVGAFQLIAKPISRQEFLSDIKRAVETYLDLHKELVIYWQGNRTVLEYKDIVFVEAKNRHLFIHTSSETYECVGKLSDYEKNMLMSGFVKTHQSFIANMNYIRVINTNDILMKNGEKVFLSKYKRKDVMIEFSKHIARSV